MMCKCVFSKAHQLFLTSNTRKSSEIRRDKKLFRRADKFNPFCPLLNVPLLRNENLHREGNDRGRASILKMGGPKI